MIYNIFCYLNDNDNRMIIGTSCCTAASQVFSFPVITVCPVRFVYVCHLGEVFQVS